MVPYKLTHLSLPKVALLRELLRNWYLRRVVAGWYIKYLFLAIDREILLVTVAMKNLPQQHCRFKVRLQSG